MRSTLDSPARPANRAERRAAARGKGSDTHAAHVPAPRRTGPAERTRPAHLRTDYVARRGG